jgi:hypothetical protein
MAGFKQGISTLFNGVDTSAQEAQATRAKETQRLTLERQRQDLQNSEAEGAVQTGKATRLPRGRRLLLAATGEEGLPGTLGG